MTKIKDLLLLDLTEDLKDVIDLEDRSEKELQYEIESYIITNKIAEYLGDFVKLYQSNMKETGVWLSGFYGSGKSYFGKMLGYLLENRLLNGTPFRDRFIHRLAGVPNQSLLENSIRGLNACDARVVFLDIAKQHTNNRFAWVLFRNFLRSLGFLDDVFGYMEYGLFLDGKYEQFLRDVERITGESWLEIRKNPSDVPKTVRKVLTGTIYSEKEYTETKAYLDQRITSYDAAKFKEELAHYISKNPNERIIFIIDEVSEAVGQKKIDLLELEGISEALSGITKGKVWTIAIAQEKLDDVINNANVSARELTKVTDRFKTKIHLSSEEVDTVIKKRLLLKEPSASQKLEQFYSDNSGLIIDSTNLNAKFPTRSDNVADFITYYPFHKYQFDLMQNFLFSVHQKAKTGGTERGMIIASHTVMKKVCDKELYSFVTASNLVDGGKKILDSDIEREFVKADNVLKDNNSPIDGTRLLKTVYFLNEAETVNASAENITKLYIDKLDGYYEFKPHIDKALADLCEANLLLEKNALYKISSDLEQKLIEEMRTLTLEFYTKKRDFIELLKKQGFIADISKCMFEGNPYFFYIISEQGDELSYSASTNKNIKFQLCSPYTVELENRDEYIEKVKFETQGTTEQAAIIPAMNHFLEIDKLIEEVIRFAGMEEKYKNDDDERVRQIIRDFGISKINKTKALTSLIEKAYKTGTIVYLFDEQTPSEGNFIRTVQEIQSKVISNTYSDRLSSQLSDDLAIKVLRETNPGKLKSYFAGKDFEFFNSDGNFIGEGLKVVEKVNSNISSIFIDGEELEKRLTIPPCGYAYGTILTVLAVLMRAGRLSVKYNGKTLYSYKDEDILTVFGKSRDYKNASFKAITTSLTMVQKQAIVDNLKALKAGSILKKEFGYSSNDIELVVIVGELADYYLKKIEEINKTITTFDAYFPEVKSRQEVLKPYLVKITDANYKTKAEEFLTGYDRYTEVVTLIRDVISFTEEKLPKLEKYSNFITHIIRELEKLGGEYKANPIFAFQEEFKTKFHESVISNFFELEKLYQKIRDEYHQLIKGEHELMAQNYQTLRQIAGQVKSDIISISETLNQGLIAELNNISDYAIKRSCTNLKIEYEINCKSCFFSLNEIIVSNQNVPAKQNEIEDIKIRIKYPEPTPGEEPHKPKKIKLTSEKGEFTAVRYKRILQDKLKQVSTLNDNDIVQVD